MHVRHVSRSANIRHHKTYRATHSCGVDPGYIPAIGKLFLRRGSLSSSWASLSVIKEQAAPGSKNTLVCMMLPSGPVIFNLQVIKSTCFLFFWLRNVSYSVDRFPLRFFRKLANTKCEAVYGGPCGTSCMRDSCGICLPCVLPSGSSYSIRTLSLIPTFRCVT